MVRSVIALNVTNSQKYTPRFSRRIFMQKARKRHIFGSKLVPNRKKRGEIKRFPPIFPVPLVSSPAARWLRLRLARATPSRWHSKKRPWGTLFWCTTTNPIRTITRAPKKYCRARFFGKRRRRRKMQRSCPFGQLLAKCALRRRGAPRPT